MANAQTKTWFITGAARGLGFEIASTAAAAGDNIVVTGRNIEKLQAAYLSHGENVLALELDVCNDNQINTCIKHAIDHFGRIDVLVNNAGYGQLGIFEEIARRKIEPQFNTNVFGLMAVTRAVLPYMGLVEQIAELSQLALIRSPNHADTGHRNEQSKIPS